MTRRASLHCGERFYFNLQGALQRNTFIKNTNFVTRCTPTPSSIAGGAAVRLLNLHHSKGQSMEEGPFVRNCQRRQGPQA